jgi:hypothetical protein
MPEISRFFGIVIHMYHREHGRSHFHAVYGEYEVIVDIATGTVIAGKMPRRALALIEEWYALRRTELVDNAERANRRESLNKILPLS